MRYAVCMHLRLIGFADGLIGVGPSAFASLSSALRQQQNRSAGLAPRPESMPPLSADRVAEIEQANFSAGGRKVARLVDKSVETYASMLLADRDLDYWEVPLRSVGLLQCAAVTKNNEANMLALHGSSQMQEKEWHRIGKKVDQLLDLLDDAAGFVTPRELPPRGDKAFAGGAGKAFKVLMEHNEEEAEFRQRIRTKFIERMHGACLD